MLRSAILDPSVWTGPLKAGFGRDQKVGRIWMKRLGDESLGNFGTVRVGSIDKIDAQFHRALQTAIASARSLVLPRYQRR